MTTITSGAGISASLKSTILAIQRTQSLIDQTQFRIASGKRVNSVVDNPDSFLTAQTLNRRAVSLNTTLDGIISKLSTIQQASDSVTALSELVTEAEEIAESAQEELTSTSQEAIITGDRSLTNFTDLPGDLAGVDNNDRLRFRFVDNNGSINSANSVVINNNDSTNDLIDEINAIVDGAAAQVFEASLNSAGQLTIKTNDNTRFEIEFEDAGGGSDTQLATALGFGDLVSTETTDGANETRVTVQSTPSLNSVSLYAVGGTVAVTTTSLQNLTDTSGGAAGDIFNGDANDMIRLSVNDETPVDVIASIPAATVQDLIDGINDGPLSSKIQASFSSGELNIRAIDSSVESIRIQLVEDGAGAGTAGKIDLQQLGFGTRVLQSAADGSSNTSSENIRLGPSAATLADLEVEYNTVREQIDELVADSEFDDVNLLNGDDITTYFNETTTSALTTEGSVFDSASLTVSEANFGTDANVGNAITETANATDRLESFTTALANDIAIIEARQTFTEETITTLSATANDLTASDGNEEGALLLTLQTRLLLGVTGLALAAQSQQSTLRLF